MSFKNISKVIRIVEAIETDISDRKGLRQEWENIDEDVLEEIREAWFNAISLILDE